MKVCTKYFDKVWEKLSPKAKEWVWFVSLWFGGLGAVSLVTYPIKLLIKNMR